MPFTNSTPNYGLPQYIATDKPTYLGDANGAYSTIDTQLKANANAAASNQNEITLLSARVLANEGNIDDRFTKAESDARYTSVPNLLDNGDLLEPVNQRGSSSYSGKAIFCIDRWKLYGDYNVVAHTLTYSSENAYSIAGLSACMIAQRSTRFGVGETVTMSAKINGSVYSKTVSLAASLTSYPMGSFHFIAGVDSSAFFAVAIESSTIVIDWVKLERGSVATPFTPKGYGAELVECYRYFWKSSMQVNMFQTTAGAYYRNTVYFPIVMRTIPTVTITSSTGTVSVNATTDDAVKFAGAGGNDIVNEFTVSADL